MKMKRLIIPFLLAFTLFSCEGPMGPMGPKGEDGDGLYWKIETYTVESEDWKLSGTPADLGSYYYYTFDSQLITDDVFENGEVKGELMNFNDRGELYSLELLPFTGMYGDVDETGQDYYWMEYYTIEYRPHAITFKAFYSDFKTDVNPPTRTFRVSVRN